MISKKIRKFFRIIGPGFITGASDDDPSGIATYSQTGARFGYGQLWTALFSFPFMAVVQEISGRIGMVTGKGLAGVIKTHYSKKILFFSVSLLVIANVINIGADLGAMASAFGLITKAPFLISLVGITALIVVLEIFIPYKQYAKFLKYLALFFLAYIVTAFIVKQNWRDIALSTFVPSFSFTKLYLLNIVAILGTTISPYLFFWQADQEVEEEVDKHKLKEMGKGTPHVTKREIRTMRVDTIFGMFFSNLIMFFIIITTASTLGAHGISTIETANEAAEALRPLAGDFAFLLFSLGIVGVGLLAVPVLAGSVSYAVSEVMGWKEGLSLKFKKAKAFYSVLIVVLVIGLLINFLPVEPFRMLYYSAALNGILAPPILVIMMLMSSRKDIMGTHTNSKFSNIFGWGITGIMTVCSVAFLVSLF